MGELERVKKLEQESKAKDVEATPEPESVTDPVKDVDAKGKSESTVLVKSEECKADIRTGAKNTDIGDKSPSPEVIVCDEDRSDDLKPEAKEVEVLENAVAKIEEISVANT